MSDKDKFGPNTKEIKKLIKRIKRITPEQAEGLGTAWEAVWEDAWGAAWTAAWGAARNAARTAALDAARTAARNAAWTAARNAAWTAAWGAARNAAWDAAWDAIYDALLAAFTGGIIPPEQTDLLLAPWASVMEAKEDTGGK